VKERGVKRRRDKDSAVWRESWAREAKQQTNKCESVKGNRNA
jgi:hypothetical protein